MLAVGVPLDAVKIKMQSKGLDPAILDLDPNEFAPVDGTSLKPKSAKTKKPVDFRNRKKKVGCILFVFCGYMCVLQRVLVTVPHPFISVVNLFLILSC
jgi:hypothetical protein